MNAKGQTILEYLIVAVIVMLVLAVKVPKAGNIADQSNVVQEEEAVVDRFWE